MAWYIDLENCDYFYDSLGAEAANSLLAVGWLERGHDFTKGNIDKEIYDRLFELLQDPFQPFIFAGPHMCDLCQWQFSEKFGGVSNLFVPNGETIFVCPELILHYIDAHWYKPPASFFEAVMACPPIRSMEYKKLLLKSGGRVLRLTPPSCRPLSPRLRRGYRRMKTTEASLSPCKHGWSQQRYSIAGVLRAARRRTAITATPKDRITKHCT